MYVHSRTTLCPVLGDLVAHCSQSRIWKMFPATISVRVTRTRGPRVFAPEASCHTKHQGFNRGDQHFQQLREVKLTDDMLRVYHVVAHRIGKCVCNWISADLPLKFVVVLTSRHRVQEIQEQRSRDHPEPAAAKSYS